MTDYPFSDQVSDLYAVGNILESHLDYGVWRKRKGGDVLENSIVYNKGALEHYLASNRCQLYCNAIMEKAIAAERLIPPPDPHSAPTIAYESMSPLKEVIPLIAQPEYTGNVEFIVKFKSWWEYSKGFDDFGNQRTDHRHVFTLYPRGASLTNEDFARHKEKPFRSWAEAILHGKLQDGYKWWGPVSGTYGNGTYGTLMSPSTQLTQMESRVALALHNAFQAVKSQLDEYNILTAKVETIYCFGLLPMDDKGKSSFVQHLLANTIREKVRAQAENPEVSIPIVSYNPDYSQGDIALFKEMLNIDCMTSVKVFQDMSSSSQTGHNILVINLSYEHAIRDIITTVSDPLILLCRPFEEEASPPKTEVDYSGGSSPPLVEYLLRSSDLSTISDFQDIVKTNRSEVEFNRQCAKYQQNYLAWSIQYPATRREAEAEGLRIKQTLQPYVCLGTMQLSARKTPNPRFVKGNPVLVLPKGQ